MVDNVVVIAMVMITMSYDTLNGVYYTFFRRCYREALGMEAKTRARSASRTTGGGGSVSFQVSTPAPPKRG